MTRSLPRPVLMPLRGLFILLLVQSLVTSCFLGFCQAVHAQTPRPQSESSDIVQIDTELVQTDVTVFDRQGRFVNGLRREQFELLIDNRPVPISFFEQVGTVGLDERTRSTRSTVSTLPAPSRHIVFFLDDLHLSGESLETVRKGLAHFLENEVRENDQVAIVSASGQIGFLQQFTAHTAVLRAALARVKPRSNTIQDTASVPMSEYVAYRIFQGDRAALNFYVNELLRSLQFTYALPKYGGKGGGFMAGSESDQAERMVLRRVDAIISQSIPSSVASLSALEGFLRSSVPVAGRKLVFFISDGFLMHQRNNELARQLLRVKDAAALADGSIYAVDAREFTGRLQTGMKVDSSGRSDTFGSGEKEALQIGFSTLSETSGGRVITPTEELGPALNDILDEFSNYYLLAWRPEGERQKVEKFKNVTVRIVDRPELRVKLSRGYSVTRGNALGGRTNLKASEGNSAAKPNESELRLENTIAGSKNLPALLSLSFLNTPNNGTVMTASTQIAIDHRIFADSSKPASVDLAGLVLNEQGKVASSFKTSLNVSPLSSPDRPDATSVIYNYRAALGPGIYQVRIAAQHRDSGRLAHAHQWLEIPDLASERLLLSSLLLDASLIENKASGAEERAPTIQHSVARRFEKNSRLNFLVFVYNAARQDGNNRTPELNAEIRVTQYGQTKLTIPALKVQIEANSDLKRLPFGGSFPLSSLAPGKYLLVVTVRDLFNQTKAAQQIDFEVE